ncbi:hypothetical protein A3L09_08660 [Thermococcus profundus]|uniref:Uncharacterized protein n=1 Tax=Thermococcus profundus TaxID=49899 RepID=A0A2Z2MF05_THEPR|nr:hypothetical protein [Thermococcus profundus]ASJ03322.1 hypothetical protein A3L09_08660 [Thermococcus profundus]
MGDIVVKVPPNVDEKLAGLIAETILERLKTLARLNEMLNNSELSEEEAVELGRKAKTGRGEYLERRYSSRG